MSWCGPLASTLSNANQNVKGEFGGAVAVLRCYLSVHMINCYNSVVVFFLSTHAELREEEPYSRLEDETQLRKRSAQSVEELLRADPEQDQYVS